MDGGDDDDAGYTGTHTNFSSLHGIKHSVCVLVLSSLQLTLSLA